MVKKEIRISIDFDLSLKDRDFTGFAEAQKNKLKLNCNLFVAVYGANAELNNLVALYFSLLK